MMPFAATMNGPRNYHTNWNKSDRERQISYEIAHMWNLMKNDTGQLVNKTESDSKISKPNVCLPKGKPWEV